MNYGCGYIVPPVCPKLAIGESCDTQSIGSETLQRYYDLYDLYISAVSIDGRRQGGVRASTSGVLCHAGDGEEGNAGGVGTNGCKKCELVSKDFCKTGDGLQFGFVDDCGLSGRQCGFCRCDVRRLVGWCARGTDTVVNELGSVCVLGHERSGDSESSGRCRLGGEGESKSVSCEGQVSETGERIVGEVVCDSDEVNRGKHWKRNRAKKENRRRKLIEEKTLRMSRDWRARVAGSGGCVSDSSASVVTVDTRTGAEIEAAQTLAARRVVENKLAIARGEVQLRSYANKDKTKALERLDAARMEQRINEAKAKSQASYKKCDESMKSLGSTGSAGEFALKQEVKRAKDNAAILAYVQAQADFMVKHVSPEVLAQVAAMPPPVLESEFDVFGDCPEDYTEDQRESYFLGLARQQEENDMRTGIPC